MALPYSNSTANPEKAQARIRTMLHRFGVDALSFTENIREREISVNFVYDGYPVKLLVDYGALSLTYIDDAPYSSRMRRTRKQYEEEKLKVAYRASFSLLQDYLKGTLTMVELNATPFAEAFLSNFVNNKGERLGSIITPQLKDFVSGRLALGAGTESE